LLKQFSVWIKRFSALLNEVSSLQEGVG